MLLKNILCVSILNMLFQKFDQQDGRKFWQDGRKKETDTIKLGGTLLIPLERNSAGYKQKEIPTVSVIFSWNYKNSSWECRLLCM